MVHKGGNSQFPTRRLGQGPAEPRIHPHLSQLQSLHFSTVACSHKPNARPPPPMPTKIRGGGSCVPYRLRGDIDVGQVPVLTHNWEMAVYLNGQRVSCQNHDPAMRETLSFLIRPFPLSVKKCHLWTGPLDRDGEDGPSPQGPQMRIPTF